MGLIARGLNLTFTEEAQQRVSLWLKIMKYRLKAPGQSFQRLRENMAFYEKDPLYQQLRELVFRSFGHYALEVREEEAMLHFVSCFPFPFSLNKIFASTCCNAPDLRRQHLPIR